MDKRIQAIAQACLDGAESNTMTFPRVVSTLIDAGFEGYCVDLRRETAAYYSQGGETLELSRAAAGCAGYLVSFPGRRVLYFSRNAETHVEHFPQAT